MRHVDEGMDLFANVGLDGLPVANRLYLYLTDVDEDSVLSATDTIAAGKIPKTTGTTVKTASGLTCTGRTLVIVPPGTPLSWNDGVGAPRAIVVASHDPATPGKALGVHNIKRETGIYGDPADMTVGPININGLQIRLLGENEG